MPTCLCNKSSTGLNERSELPQRCRLALSEYIVYDTERCCTRGTTTLGRQCGYLSLTFAIDGRYGKSRRLSLTWMLGGMVVRGGKKGLLWCWRESVSKHHDNFFVCPVCWRIGKQLCLDRYPKNRGNFLGFLLACTTTIISIQQAIRT